MSVNPWRIPYFCIANVSINFQAKDAIRRLLPLGLKEEVSKVRSSVAYAVAAIAQWDWPEEWPELFQILVEALTSTDPVAVHGAMRVLTGQKLFSICKIVFLHINLIPVFQNFVARSQIHK